MLFALYKKLLLEKEATAFRVDLVANKLGNAIFRVTCWFHLMHHLDNHLAYTMHVSIQIRCTVKRVIFQLSLAPSAPAVLALWRVYKQILVATFADADATEKNMLERVFMYLGNGYLKRGGENFGFFQAYAPHRMTATGPVANRTTACAEAGWKSLRGHFRRLSVRLRLN